MLAVLRALSQKALPALFWLAVMLAFDSASMCIATCLAAALHELGHIAAGIAITGGELSLPRATLTGLRIYTGRLLSYGEEIIVAAAGPLFNVAAFLLTLPFFGGGGYIAAFGLINLLSAVSNLIPVRGYDGYRILGALLSRKIGAMPCERIMSTLAVVLSGAAALLSLVILMLSGEGYWVFGVFFGVLVKEISKKHSSDEK